MGSVILGGMVSEAKKDQTAGHDASQSAAFHDNLNGYAPKVRKPYTITKQREKWTEEEHRRFVEALQLYGRAWRQIEDHVGSKTAIQIRSHAQKFFAKVSRDSSVDAEGSSSPVQIPPPRPKKKPLHPYPRKAVDRANIETSVLSPVGSDILESRVAEMHESRLSPSSCTTDALSFTKNNNAASNRSSKEEHSFRLSMNISSPSVPDDKSTMKLELFCQQTESTLDSPYSAEPYPSIKLFGKTVVLRDTRKQSSEIAENSESSVGCGVNEKSESNSDNVDSQVAFDFVSDSPVANTFCHMDNTFALPCYTWYCSLMYPYPLPCEKRADEENTADSEGSLVESKHLSSPGEESSKGFVPYKRCLAERDDTLLQGREGQRARICS